MLRFNCNPLNYDDTGVTTYLLLYRKFFGLKERHVSDDGEAKKKARLEAVAKLGANHKRILDDILQNSGILRVSTGS